VAKSAPGELLGAGEWPVGSAKVLIIGVPKQRNHLFIREAISKMQVRERYAEAERLCYPRSIRILGLSAGRYGGGAFMLDPQYVLKAAQDMRATRKKGK